MESAKIKTLVIIVLLIVNAFLLGIYLSDKREERETEAEERSDVARFYDKSGVTLPSWDDMESASNPLRILSRDIASESAVVAELLGNAEGVDIGGGIYVYESFSGAAVFRGSGEFEIVFSSGRSFDGAPESYARELVKALGASVSDTPAEFFESGLTLNCSYAGAPVFGAEISFEFEESSLTAIRGQIPLIGAAEVSAQERITLITALVSFLNTAKEENVTAVESVEAGYIIGVSLSGAVDLHPVWKISTDRGSFYVSAVTGREESPE